MSRQTDWYALGVWQPWASLLVSGQKDVENREWQRAPGLQSQLRAIIARGDRLVIHASKTLQRSGLGVARSICGAQLDPRELPLGALVGTVTPHALTDWSGSDWYVPGQMAIEVRGAVKFDTPLPFVGRQGFIRLDEGMVARVLEQLTWKGVDV